MIATVTLNPSLDEALSIDAVTLGGTNRCTLDALDPGGKGVNASRVIHRLGRETIALGFAGGATGAMLLQRLHAEGVPHDFEDVVEMTRLNVMLYERLSGRRSRLYLPGARIEPVQAARLLARLHDLKGKPMIVLGGSIPPGLPETIYAGFVTALRVRGVDAIVDTSGSALEAVLGARPILVKPNVEEAEALLGRRLPDDDAILEAAEEIRRRGPRYVVISQGADGAIGVGPGEAWKAIPPTVVARSTVGSGDSMVAGLAVALSGGEGLAAGLPLGTATGAATAMVPGTQLCAALEVRRLLPEVVIRPIVVAVMPGASR